MEMGVAKLPTCEMQTLCQACVEVAFCVFLTLLNGDSDKCVPEEDVVHFINRTKTVTHHEKDCYRIQKYEPLSRNFHLLSVKEIMKWGIIRNYNSSNAPTSVTSKPTTITLRINFKEFYLNLSLAEPKVNLQCFLFLKWDDPRLDWSKNNQVVNHYYPGVLPTSMDKITSIRFPETKLWRPTIVSHDGSIFARKLSPEQTELTVEQNGTVTFSFEMNTDAKCETNVLRWPLYYYSCTIGLVFASTSTSTSISRPDQFKEVKRSSNKNETLTLVSLPNPRNRTDIEYLSVDQLKASPDWKLVRPRTLRRSTRCKNCIQPYIIVLFDIKSKSETNYFYPMFTALGIVFMTFVVLMLRPTSGKKISVACFAIVFTVFLYFHLGSGLPQFYQNTPLLFILYGVSLFFLVTSTISSLFLIFSSEIQKRVPFPKFLQIIISPSVEKYFNLRLRKVDQSVSEPGPEPAPIAIVASTRNNGISDIVELYPIYSNSQNNPVNPVPVEPLELQQEREQDEDFDTNSRNKLQANDSDKDKVSLETHINFDWLLLVAVIERIFLVLYIITFTVIVLRFLFG